MPMSLAGLWQWMTLLIFQHHGSHFEPGPELWLQFLYFDHGCEALVGLATLSTHDPLLDIESILEEGALPRRAGDPRNWLRPHSVERSQSDL